MGDVLLNGRKAADWELAAVERERDLELLAGVLAGEAPRPGLPRPVTDLLLDLP
jgi:hypothetical protein